MGKIRGARKFIQGAIKRKGALTARKKPGESTMAAASRIENSPHSSTLAKQQANFYTNVLAKAHHGRQ